jgi:malate dehydrogenase (oxaloacetate-decarboxylating)
VVINGAGAAGTAIMKMLSSKNSPFRVKNIIVCDSKGIVYSGRRGNTKEKKEIAQASNKNKLRGTITDALIGADVFVGVSKPNILHDKHIKSMNSKPIIFALSNPVPEIMPDVAIKAGAAVIATGRSDFPNQVNNVLAFPGIFRGALDAKAKRITEDMKQGAAIALAKVIKKPMANKILPNPFDKKIALAVAGAVAKSWKKKKS